MEVIGELLQLDDFDDFIRLLKRHPQLSSHAGVSELKQASTSPGYGPMFGRALTLLENSRNDPADAWRIYMQACDHAKTLGAELDELDAKIEAARADSDFVRALELIERALPIAEEAGYGQAVCSLLGRRGLSLWSLNTEHRALEIDAAIEAFEGGLELAVPGETAANLLMHLGLAFGERVNGDPADNLDNSIRALRAGLEQSERLEDPDLGTMVQTNLAACLVRSERSGVAQLLEAADLCRQALTYRRPDRNGDDWAYSKLNLGEVLQRLARLDDREASLDEAEAEYLEVIAHERIVRDKGLVGIARHAVGQLALRAAHQSLEDIIAAQEGRVPEDQPDPGQFLGRAREHLEAARELIAGSPDRLRYGRVLDDLSEALAQLGESDQAIAVAREALRLLRPTTAPSACREVAWRLGRLLSERGDWTGASIAFRDAVEAAEFTFHARMDTNSREDEIRRSGNLYRWAAYALARSGDAAEAVLVLDGGRGRELRRRLHLQYIDDEALASLPSALHEEYRSAARAFVSTPMDGSNSIPARRLQEVLTAIRQIPGHEHFGGEPQWSDISPALEPGWPVVYVNPTPSGTLFIYLWHGEGGATVDTKFVDETTSEQVFMRLAVGDAAETEARSDGGSPHSYLFGITGHNWDEADFRDGLHEALQWLGERIARPLHEGLSARHVDGVTLVLCGPIGLAPLHAAPWQDDGVPTSLCDKLTVRYGPSAVISAVARRRAESADRAPRRLVALADPYGDLRGARPEIEEIAALFGKNASTCAMGARAGKSFLRDHAGGASHVHLACHAQGGIFDATEAAILLASGPLAPAELTELTGLTARLVVISACQSAQSPISGQPDEVISVATAMLASGSACAIASLWPVDDFTTALLMTRLYQEMLIESQRPPEALRRAQLWLRHLSATDEQAFLGLHPALALEYRRRVERGAPPGRRGSKASGGGVSGGPYAHPDCWAPFVAVGV